MKHKPYRYPLYLSFRLLEGVVLLISRDVALLLASGLARLAFIVARREREKTLLHLNQVYGEEKSPEEIQELACRVFIHLAQVAVDVLRFPKLSREELDRLVEKGDGFSVMNQVLSEGQGAIILTAHLGNWELMGALFRLYDYPGAVVGRRIYYEKFNQALINLREKVTLRTIYQDASPREFLDVLHRNEILGILADQDVDRLDGIFVPFLGRPAYTVTSPVKLALATGAPIVPVFLIREGKRYRLLVEEPIRIERGGTRDDILEEYTARWSRVVEEKIRAYPDQWVWMHRRWKTTPPSSSSGVKREALPLYD